MPHRNICLRFALYYGAYTVAVFGLEALLGPQTFESLDAIVIFGISFYLVKTFTDQHRRTFSEYELRELLGLCGATIFLLRAVVLTPSEGHAKAALMASLLTVVIQVFVIFMAIVAVRYYNSMKRS